MKELYAIDSKCTIEKDDAFNINISNNSITIRVAMPYMLDLEKNDLKKAKNKGLSKYRKKEYMFNDNIIKKKTLKNGINKVFLFSCVLDGSNLNIINYNFTVENVNIKCYNFENYKSIINMEDINYVSNLLEQRRLSMNKLVYVRPSFKIDNENEVLVDESEIKRIIASFMLLVNEFAAKELKVLEKGKEFTKKDTLTLRKQNKVFFEKNITNKHASKYTSHELLLSNFFLDSSDFNNNKFDNYTYVTSPLRRYIDIIVQDIIINHNTDYSLFDNDNTYPYTFQGKELKEKQENSYSYDLSRYHYYRYKPTYGDLILKVKDRKYYRLSNNDIAMSKDKFYNQTELLSSVFYNNKILFTSKV